MLSLGSGFCTDVGNIIRSLETSALPSDATGWLDRAREAKTGRDALNVFRELKTALDVSKANPSVSEPERENLHTYSDRLGVLLEKEEARIAEVSKDVLGCGKRVAADEPSGLLEAPFRKGRRANEIGLDVNKAEEETTERKRPAESSPPNEPSSKRQKTDTRLTDLPSTAIQEMVGYLSSESKKSLLEVALHSREAGAMREGLFFDRAIPLLHVVSEFEKDPEVLQLYTKVYGKPLVITPNFLQERSRAVQAKDVQRVQQLNGELLNVSSALKEIERDWNALSKRIKILFGNCDDAEISTGPQSLKLALSAIRAYNLACVGRGAFDLAFDLTTIQRQDLIDRGEEVAQRLEVEKESVTQLDLEGVGLTKLPREIWGLLKLERLYLEDNFLTELSSDIGALGELQVLWLTRNKLKQLPREIGNLVKLEHLFVDDNSLDCLPSEIANLTRLSRLGLDYNRFTDLPREIWNLLQLEELYASYNYLTDLPSEIGNLSRLKYLLLSHNCLKQLPQIIQNLSPLKELDVVDNSLAELPLEIGSLPRLKRLKVRGNSITALPPMQHHVDIDDPNLKAQRL